MRGVCPDTPGGSRPGPEKPPTGGGSHPPRRTVRRAGGRAAAGGRAPGRVRRGPAASCGGAPGGLALSHERSSRVRPGQGRGPVRTRPEPGGTLAHGAPTGPGPGRVVPCDARRSAALPARRAAGGRSRRGTGAPVRLTPGPAGPGTARARRPLGPRSRSGRPGDRRYCGRSGQSSRRAPITAVWSVYRCTGSPGSVPVNWWIRSSRYVRARTLRLSRRAAAADTQPESK